MRPFISFSILLLLPFFIGFSSKNAVDFSSGGNEYCNARFDFCLQYPTAIFTHQINSDNADGVSLFSDDGMINAKVYGAYNIVGTSMEDFYQEMVTELSTKNKKIVVLKNDVNKTNYEATVQGDKTIVYYHAMQQDNNVVVTLTVSVPKGMEEMLHSLQKDLVLHTHS
ncbi:MAG: hypothetical protein GC192_15955 [Bacteroidetes bacterium]|nr:hypothetical protein [Bacteroidota bacterium]